VNESPVGSQSRDLARTAVRVESSLSGAELQECLAVFGTAVFFENTPFSRVVPLSINPRSAELSLESICTPKGCPCGQPFSFIGMSDLFAVFPGSFQLDQTG